MPTPRDIVRASRHEFNRVAAEQGINMDAERTRIGSNQRVLTVEAGKLINNNTPRINAFGQRLDDPPSGVFDGVNATFVLSSRVAGLNIDVIWGDTQNNRTIPLTRTSQNPPPNEAFFFDPNDPTTIVVANPPVIGDRLIAVYRVEL